jgi:hypothetical protein
MEKEVMQKKIDKYIKENTTEVGVPECNKCHNNAEVYDTLAGENFCLYCLRKDLENDPVALEGV